MCVSPFSGDALPGVEAELGGAGPELLGAGPELLGGLGWLLPLGGGVLG